ncbi:MAG: hypothetical protein JWN84_2993, partial [Nocardioides sp.]|nr:hypothetical protein [Nocardioides sp.]
MMLGPFALLLVVVLLAQPERAVPVEGSTAGAHGGHGADGAVDHAGMRMASVSAGTFAARAPLLPTRGWTAKADAAARGHGARAAIDGRRATTWMTPRGARAPHVLTIDTRGVRTMSGLRYTPETARSARRVGRYTVQVSRDGRSWKTVSRGLFNNDAKVKTAGFAATDARYVRLSATNVAGARRAVAVAEVGLLGGPLDVPLDRSRWSAAADSQDLGRAPALAIDGDPMTSWHSVVTDDPAPTLPKAIVIDTAAPQRMGALSYTPRQDGQASGRIGAYVVEVSTDGVTYR